MEDLSIQIDLGTIRAEWGALSIKLDVNDRGTPSVQIYAFDPSDLRRGGAVVKLNEDNYRELKEKLAKLDQRVTKLVAIEQANGMFDPHLGGTITPPST